MRVYKSSPPHAICSVPPSHTDTNPAPVQLRAPFSERPHVIWNGLRNLRFRPGSFGIIRTCHLKTGCIGTFPRGHICTSLSQTTRPKYQQSYPCCLHVFCRAQSLRSPKLHPCGGEETVIVIYLLPLTAFLLPRKVCEMLHSSHPNCASNHFFCHHLLSPGSLGTQVSKQK